MTIPLLAAASCAGERAAAPARPAAPPASALATPAAPGASAPGEPRPCGLVLADAVGLADVGSLQRARDLAAEAKARCATPELDALARRVDAELSTQAASGEARQRALAELGRARADLAAASAAVAARRFDEAASRTRAAAATLRESTRTAATPEGLLELSRVEDALGDPVAARRARSRALAVAERGGAGVRAEIVPRALAAGAFATEVGATPDGRAILVWSSDGLVAWDAASGAVLSRSAHALGSSTLAHHPSAPVVFFASGRAIVAWDWSRGAEVGRLELGDRAAEELAVDARSRLVVYVDDERAIHAVGLDLKGPRLVARLPASAESVRAAGGVVAAIAGRELHTFDVATGRALGKRPVAPGYRRSFELSPSGKSALYPDERGYVLAPSGAGAAAPLAVAVAPGSAVAFDGDDAVVAVVGSSLTRVEGGKARRVAEIGFRASFDPTGAHVVVESGGRLALRSSRTGAVEGAVGGALGLPGFLWFDAEGRTLRVAMAHDGIGWGATVVWSASRTRALDGSAGYGARATDRLAVARGTALVEYDLASGAPVREIQLPKGTYVGADRVVAGDRKRLRLLDAQGRELAALDEVEPSSFRLDASANVLAAIDAKGGVRVADARQSGDARLEAKEIRVATIAVSADGKRLAGAGGRTVIVWDLASRAVVAKVELPGPAHAVTLDERGARLAVDAGVLEVHDVGRGRACASPPLLGRGGSAVDLAFHPTSPRLAASLRDGTVRVYDATSCAEIAALGAKVATKDLVPTFDFSSMVERPAPRDDKLPIDWAVVAATGRVDGSLGGRDLVRVPVAGQALPAELAWDRDERPGLFGALLGL